MRNSRLHRVVPLLGAAALTLAPLGVRADDGLRLDYTAAGARSLGLGGAFLGLADEASAAAANPAGLTRLSQREITLGYSFGSFVYPGPRWSVAVHGRHLVDLTRRVGLSGERTATTDLDLFAVGLSAAVELTDDLSLGLGWEHHQLDLKSQTGGFATLDETDQSGSARVGLLWRPARAWSIGGVYRQGLRFELGALDLELPAVYGLGCAHQPTELWTFSLDVVRVEQADLVAALPVVERPLTFGGDATEIRFGAERNLPVRRGMVAVRVGFWHEPAPLHYRGENIVLQSLFPGGEDETHVTFGLGRSLTNLQVDAALDYSQRETRWSVSAGTRF